MKILLAIDGSPCSEAAVTEVARRPWPDDSEFRVVTAYEVPLPPTPDVWAVPASYLEEMDKATSDHASSIINSAIAKLRSTLGPGANIKSQVAPGSPREVILDVAKEWGADLIIVGSHGYGTWERLLLGSVSQSVVSHAKCSVEVVRCPEGTRVTQDAIATDRASTIQVSGSTDVRQAGQL